MRVRADALGFAKLSAEPVDDAEEDENNEPRYEIDLEMLPTMLVYRAGDLRFNWVRVDLEAGKSGVSDLLARYVYAYANGKSSDTNLPIARFIFVTRHHVAESWRRDQKQGGGASDSE